MVHGNTLWRILTVQDHPNTKWFDKGRHKIQSNGNVTCTIQKCLPDGSSTNTVCNFDGFIYIICLDGCCQTIHCFVRSFNYFIDIFEFHNLLNWSKDLRSSLHFVDWYNFMRQCSPFSHWSKSRAERPKRVKTKDWNYESLSFGSFCTILATETEPGEGGEGEVAVFSAKRWDRRNS